jgi:pyruvyltransferase
MIDQTVSNTKLLKVIADSRNWGDMVAPYLYRVITKRNPTCVEMLRETSMPHFLTIGSVLRMADSKSIVWGTGFLTPDDGIGFLNWRRQNSEVRQRPMSIRAVRGPLTREKLLKMGIDCPEVYGDPAWLLARFHTISSSPRFRLGIIPHFKDRNCNLIRVWQKMDNVSVIDPVCSRLAFTTHQKYVSFLEKLQNCSYLISSSLHGLIMADAFGIPAMWCLTSDTAWESEFKFFDYFLSVGRPNTKPIYLRDMETVPQIINKFNAYKLRDYSDQLLNACPF